MTIQIKELQELLTKIDQDNNDNEILSIKPIQDKIEQLQTSSNDVMQDFAECCFEQQDEISTQIDKIQQLTQQVQNFNSNQLETGAPLCKDLKACIEEISNDFQEIMNEDFVESGQIANLYEQISMFMLDATQKTAFIPAHSEIETTQIEDKSRTSRKSVIPATSLEEIKQALQDKGEDTENKMINLVQKICDEMEDKHGKQIDNLHKTNDDTFNKMKAMMVELNMYKYTNQNLSPRKVTNNYRKFLVILLSSWMILGGVFAKYHFYVIEQLKAQYETKNQISKFMLNTAQQSIGVGSMLMSLVIGMLITMVLAKFGVDVMEAAWNVCKICWSGIKWIFHMILPENIYVMVFEFGEKKRWKRRGSNGRLVSYEEDTVKVKKVRVRGK